MVVWGEVWARPVSEGSLVCSKVRAVTDVAERCCGDTTIEAADAVCSPYVEDDLAVGERGRVGGATDEGLLVHLD